MPSWQKRPLRSSDVPSLIHRFSLKQILSEEFPRITGAALAQLSAALALSTGSIGQMKDSCVIGGEPLCSCQAGISTETGAFWDFLNSYRKNTAKAEVCSFF